MAKKIEFWGQENDEYLSHTEMDVAIESILNDYTIWRCVIVERETIDVAKWVKENRPDWLKID